MALRVVQIVLLILGIGLLYLGYQDDTAADGVTSSYVGRPITEYTGDYSEIVRDSARSTEAEAVASGQRYDLRESAEKYKLGGILALVAFALALIPWSRLGDELRGRANDAAEGIGVVTQKAKALSQEWQDERTTIVGRDGSCAYSVADELRKWDGLLADGLVTQEEFDRARDKLLKRRRV